jgi:2-iminobutanoate/2-iminopropanoate deaminase
MPSPHPFLPAPSFRRAGDYIFASSVYPIDEHGELARSPSGAHSFGDSEMAAQTRSVLENLKAVLAEAGTTLERTLKVELYLVDPADFPEFKHVYRAAFPHDPPARTTLVVGDEHPVAGARLNLHAVALAADSPHERVVIQAADVPDPLDAEHASLAVKAGPFIFASGFPATDFRSGLAAGRTPGLPNFGSDAAFQARYVIDNLERVLRAGGSSLEQAVKVQFYETDLLNFHEVDPIWGAAVGVPPTRSSMACRGFLVPGALFAVNLLGLVAGHGLEKQETRAGLRWHPRDAGKANFSPGIEAGDWLFTAGQIPVPDISKHAWVGAPPGLPHHWNDIEIQAEFTMELLHEQLVANGYDLGDVVDARIYLVDPRRDFRGFTRVWDRLYPDITNRPAMSLIPSRQTNGLTGVMVDGPTLEIDLISKKASP